MNAKAALEKLEMGLGKNGLEYYIGEKGAKAIRSACEKTESPKKATAAKKPTSKES